MSQFDYSGYRRLVVKVGSSLLVGDDGHLDREWLDRLADDIAELSRNGHEILVVSSGSIAIGSGILGIDKSVHAWKTCRQPQPLARFILFMRIRNHSNAMRCRQHRYCSRPAIQKIAGGF